MVNAIDMPGNELLHDAAYPNIPSLNELPFYYPIKYTDILHKKEQWVIDLENKHIPALPSNESDSHQNNDNEWEITLESSYL